MLKPLGNRVLLEVIKEEEKTVSGLVLPESAKEKPQTAKVVAVGSGKVLEDGKRADMDVAVGDKVIFEKYAGSEVKYEGNEYLVVKDSDIIAVVE
ncbi:co-chaperone GroES [Marinilactibacillus psychrotolerans]|uniref:Co-chaperonin GroES n=2 Tax=Marinilactibacillus psychrotolerans TaxID=191770 RepID=A0A511GZJ3_9LACT|nr:co-chaperone GroES [Marinilactibacillus psychrotolerans]TLQ09682.1 co-chaperone GroES [Marinilactibacillus psychrotolerans]SDD24798.1 chaperonin GroES [Marinilactibacillus psychrotolerans]SJN30643.1 Heat shock protein 60 family co-chaperone GroES [Marinilactibacillus psychrotolerans 42ea]GEL66675.1 10 kDa chaperonin [Marinilactibacillus psychrotolerans]GEQ33246.1 co-chaperonin GroES [Marinilactibacillus psychrotolerans]